MRPAATEYHRPSTLEEALQKLAQDPESRALAGGHSLIPAMNLRLAQPTSLVDIGRLDELRRIEVRGDRLIIGALATHAQIAASPDVREHASALAVAAGLVGDPQVRNWGTIGGNLAHADPASDPPTVVLAQGGTIHLKGNNGSRSVAASDFFLDLFVTDIQPGELITHVELPSASNQASAYLKLPHPASRYALVGVAVLLGLQGDTCSSASVAIGGATPTVRRGPGAEAALTGSSLGDDALENASAAFMAEIGDDLIGDHFAPADYRRAMAGVFLKRAVRRALAG